jgi:hypothetical protein
MAILRFRRSLQMVSTIRWMESLPDTAISTGPEAANVGELSKFRRPWSTRERNHIANIGHAGDELYGSFQAQAKA